MPDAAALAASPATPRIRPLDAGSAEEIECVACGMRATLEEALGAERGQALYDMEWLRDRVRAHLDLARLDGLALVAETAAGVLVGHLLARLERDGERTIGLVATVFVHPDWRRGGLAGRPFDAGEAWLRARGAATLAYDTAEDHVAMRRLLERRGYRITFRSAAQAMVRLARPAAP
jgi:GNAT superfamily N-acetyltransferase